MSHGQRDQRCTWTLMVLPRLLLFWLSETVTELLQSASKPRIPPTQSPMTHTCKMKAKPTVTNSQNRFVRTRSFPHHPSLTDLAAESSSFWRLDEVTVNLIGSEDDRCHGVLVLRRRRSQERQSGERDVVLTAGQTALIVAVRTQTAGRRGRAC